MISYYQYVCLYKSLFKVFHECELWFQTIHILDFIDSFQTAIPSHIKSQNISIDILHGKMIKAERIF